MTASPIGSSGFYLGVTDPGWFRYLKALRPDEVNFWKPSEGAFKMLEPGGLFLFKLKFPENAISGGGIFTRYTPATLSMAWQAFEKKNGADTFADFRRSIGGHLAKSAGPDPAIGCIVLSQPFFWDKVDWIAAPASFKPNVVSGRGYRATESDTVNVLGKVRERLERAHFLEQADTGQSDEPLEKERYGNPLMIRQRLGQGGFRFSVLDAYQRRCAITGEKTMPVLEAAHIRPYAEMGPHSVPNGLLLRSDFHKLFDAGLVTVTKDFHLEVSKKIREEWDNGKEYYAFHGKKLSILPEKTLEMPKPDYLAWHNENVFRS